MLTLFSFFCFFFTVFYLVLALLFIFIIYVIYFEWGSVLVRLNPTQVNFLLSTATTKNSSVIDIPCIS